jgi:hypothetical protein
MAMYPPGVSVLTQHQPFSILHIVDYHVASVCIWSVDENYCHRQANSDLCSEAQAL